MSHHATIPTLLDKVTVCRSCLICCVLRMLDVVQSRISSIMREDVLLECLQTAPPKSYRIEEVPNDELNLGQDDLLVPAAHFNKVHYDCMAFALCPQS